MNLKSFLLILVIHLGLMLATEVSAQDHPDIISVESVTELKQAFATISKTTKPVTILVQPGLYNVRGGRLVIPREHIKVLGATGSPKDVVFDGGGMKSGVGFLFDVSHSFVTFSGMTFRGVRNHLIQVRAERGASFFTLTNCIMQDAREQLLKISASSKLSSPYSDEGRVSGCTFEYTEGVGPQYYIGGIDCHRCRDWLVENNVFKNIASPEDKTAQHAIHFWRKSENTIVKNNIIINADRAIGFGLGMSESDHKGGLIAENFIFNQGKTNHPRADVGIVLESAKDAVIANNFVYLMSNYPNAIEYRFESSVNNVISNNYSNRLIKRRDGAKAELIDNHDSLDISATANFVFEHLLKKYNN